MSLALRRFRSEFPASEHLVWLNTAATPPGARSVTRALRAALEQWENGTHDLQAWEAAAAHTREQFAALVGSVPSRVALVGSLAEGAATVAGMLDRGRVVVGAREFRSNLFPWLRLRSRGFDVHLVGERPDRALATEDVIAATRPGTALVAVSEVQSIDGSRLRIAELAEHCGRVGALLFVNATQCAGVLDITVTAREADFVAVHGYKWLLAPRGAGWLHVREEHLPRMEPLAPNWKNTDAGFGELYGGPYRISGSANRLDVSLAWFSWVGAEAALALILDAGIDAIQEQALGLAEQFADHARDLGWSVGGSDLPSHLLSIGGENPDAVMQRLRAHGIIASARGGRVRLGFHGFNTRQDLTRALAALGPPRRE